MGRLGSELVVVCMCTLAVSVISRSSACKLDSVSCLFAVFYYAGRSRERSSHSVLVVICGRLSEGFNSLAQAVRGEDGVFRWYGDVGYVIAVIRMCHAMKVAHADHVDSSECRTSMKPLGRMSVSTVQLLAWWRWAADRQEFRGTSKRASVGGLEWRLRLFYKGAGLACVEPS